MSGRVLIYMTIGYPSIEEQIDFVRGLDSTYVTGIELGYPSSNPRYDGPVIRQTHNPEIRKDRNAIRTLFEECGQIVHSVTSLMYYSDYIQEDHLIDFLAGCGARDFIVPDLLIDYAQKTESLIHELENSDSRYVPFFNAATPDRVISNIEGRTSSWIYYGLQPSTGINMPYDIGAVVGRAIECLPRREINFGFGIRNREDVSRIIEAGGSGIAVGSVLVNDLRDRNFNSAYNKISEFSEVIKSAV